jgi:THO complex subunit 2
VWDVLKLFPYQTRYDAYARWRAGYARHPLLTASKAEATGEARKILRRISKDNVKQLGRQLGKATHANPAAVLETVLSQVRFRLNL